MALCDSPRCHFVSAMLCVCTCAGAVIQKTTKILFTIPCSFKRRHQNGILISLGQYQATMLCHVWNEDSVNRDDVMILLLSILILALC
eukprot:g7921.t1